MLTYHDEEQAKWEPSTASDERALVGVILECEDHEHEDRAGQELFEELSGLGSEVRWIGSEDAGRGGVSTDRSDTVTFNHVDSVDVVGVYDTSSQECSKDLCDPVHWQTSPWELAEQTAGEGDGWVQESTAVASDVDTQHEADTESPVDVLPRAVVVAVWVLWVELAAACLAQGHLSDTSETFDTLVTLIKSD